MPRPYSKKLSSELIVKRATHLIAVDGFTGLSMRKLAADLGVEAMSLYNYFANKETLLDAVTDSFVADIKTPDNIEDWKEDLWACMTVFRATALESPNVVAMLLSRRGLGTNMLHLVDRFLSIMLRAGFSTEKAVLAARLLMIHLSGTLLREVEQRAAANQSEIDRRSEQLRKSGFKSVSESAEFLSIPTGEEEFKIGLGLIIDKISDWATVKTH